MVRRASAEMNEVEWGIDRFVRCFEPSYERFLWYAAVPIVLTPELVGYLRSQFLPLLPWVAEADLLLSDLCREVGYERYVMDSGVQAELLGRLEREEPEQVEIIAKVLVGYVQHLARTNSYVTQRQQKYQQWAAMLCVAELRDEAVGQMGDEFAHWGGAVTEPGSFGAGKAELAWLSGIVQELAPRLLEHSGLVALAGRVSEAMRQPEKVKGDAAIEFVVGDRTLAFPMALLGNPLPNSLLGYPALQTFEFETASLEEGEELVVDELPKLEWQNITFEFKTAQLSVEESGFLRRKKKKELFKIIPGSATVAGYVEPLGNGIKLNMVQIPAGRFLMGAPEEELESASDERPQHWVTVPEFYMGQCLVTQAQWRSVATALPQIKIVLDANPSNFKGDNLPVERVSWDHCVEFCARLSLETGREYRLPSEAEWEYACRAGTTTPFHFGETIDTELANYDADNLYGRGRKGKPKNKTTVVGTFPANDFGLYDMHGNLWEWCADDWHSNYEEAPTDGTIWNASNDSGSDPDSDTIKVLRGGSWIFNPWRCRSASRVSYAAGTRYFSLGFRVVSCVPRTLHSP